MFVKKKTFHQQESEMDRISRLEAQVQRLRLLLVCVVVIFLAMVVVGAARGPQDKVSARKLEIVDEQGRVGIEMWAGNAQSQIVLSSPADDGSKTGGAFIKLHAWHSEDHTINESRLQMVGGWGEFDVQTKKDGIDAHANGDKGKELWRVK